MLVKDFWSSSLVLIWFSFSCLIFSITTLRLSQQSFRFCFSSSKLATFSFNPWISCSRHLTLSSRHNFSFSLCSWASCRDLYWWSNNSFSLKSFAWSPVHCVNWSFNVLFLSSASIINWFNRLHSSAKSALLVFSSSKQFFSANWEFSHWICWILFSNSLSLVCHFWVWSFSNLLLASLCCFCIFSIFSSSFCFSCWIAACEVRT